MLGPVPGMIGCLQAIEAIKVLLTMDNYKPTAIDGQLRVNKTDTPHNNDNNPSDDEPKHTIRSSSSGMQPLLGRQVVYDGLSGEFHNFQLPVRDLCCKVTSDNSILA